MQLALLLMPPELLVFLVIASGFAMIVGARKLAASLMAGVLAIAFLPVFLAPLFNALPAPLLMLITVGLGIAVVFTVLRLLSNATIGRNATDNMVGILAADVVRGTTRGVFGLLGTALRGLWRVLTLPFRL